MDGLRRRLWWVLLAEAILFVVFGVSDTLIGITADPGITVAITGLSPAELQTASAEGYRLADFMTRSQGLAIAVFGLLFATVLLVPYRASRRWAWYAAYLLPAWAIAVPLLYVAFGLAPGAPPAPPMISGPIVAVVSVLVLVADRGEVRGRRGIAMTPYTLVVVGHVFLVIVAFGAHGAAALSMFEVKRESDRARLAAVLDLSIRSFSVAIWALLGAVLLGIAAMVMGNHVGRLWVWVSVVVLVAMVLLMTSLAGQPMNRVRRALGLRSDRSGPGVDPTREPLSDAELTAARTALRPGLVSLVGLTGLGVLVWLMEAKPF